MRTGLAAMRSDSRSISGLLSSCANSGLLFMTCVKS